MTTILEILLSPFAAILGALPERWFRPVATEETSDEIPEDVWERYHPCMGCGQPLLTRSRFCDDQCRREYQMREINSEAAD